MDLFKRIIDQVPDLPLIEHITLTGLGETLLDKYLIERIRYIRSKMPHVLLDMYTNGSQLTHEKVDALIDAGLSILYVSLNGNTGEQRSSVMYPHKPGYDDYDRVCEVVDYAIAKWKETAQMRVCVKAIVSKDLFEVGDADMFMQRWNGPTDKGGNGYLHLEGNWAGAMYPMRIKPKKACGRALGEIMVLRDGRVSLCCFDGEGKEILGDLNHQTIRDVFNGPKAFGIREKHWTGRRNEIELCANCTAI